MKNITFPLLSLLLPSCIVVFIRDLENIMFDTHTFHSLTLNMASNDDINMAVDSFDNLFKNISNNFDEMRGRSLALSVYSFKTSLMFSSDFDKDYPTRMKKASDRMDKDDSVASSDSI